VSANLEMLPARPRGRPSLYDAAHCERVLELAAEGCGKAEIAAALSISRKTLNAWIKAHGEFREAMNRAKELEYAWWLAAGRKGQFLKTWNATSWALQMRNRFSGHFRDRTVVVRGEESKDTANADRLRNEMERKLSRIADASAAEEVSLGPDAERARQLEL
jgi:hypothetical protein